MVTPPIPGSIRVLVGYDGSPSSINAVEIAAQLIPSASALVVHLWQPPFTSPELGSRLVRKARTAEELADLLETEGRAEAERLVRNGVTLAGAAGWQEADPLVQRSYGGDGYQFARLAKGHGADLVVLGSRGLSGARAVLGSVSDLVVHVSEVPALVVPCPLTEGERAAARSGPVLVATDGSSGAERAADAAARLFPDRELLRASVEVPGEVDPLPAEQAADGVIRLPNVGRPSSARAIAATLAECGADRGVAVLVVGSRGRSAAASCCWGAWPGRYCTRHTGLSSSCPSVADLHFVSSTVL